MVVDEDRKLTLIDRKCHRYRGKSTAFLDVSAIVGVNPYGAIVAGASVLTLQVVGGSVG